MFSIVGSDQFMRDTNLKYEIIIYWSDEDQAFIAEMPELAGCAADGESPHDTLQSIDTVAREWIETAHEMGRDISRAQGTLALRLIAMYDLSFPP